MSEQLCTKCQKFFGNPQNLNMCSVCFKYLAIYQGNTSKNKESSKRYRISKCPKCHSSPLLGNKIIRDALSARKKLDCWDSDARDVIAHIAILIGCPKTTSAMATLSSKPSRKSRKITPILLLPKSRKSDLADP